MRHALRSVVACLVLMAAPAMADGAVTVWDTSGKRPQPCPAVDADDPRALSGGCLVEMHTGAITILIRSVVGDVEFGTCLYEHDMRIDGSGRTYLEGIKGGGPSPCNDMGACDHEDELPWHGQIEAAPNGRLTHVVDACFDTCMGQFIGELELGLKRVGGRWQQNADRGVLVGDSGYQLDGIWDMEQRHIDIRPSGGSARGEVTGPWRLAREPVGWPLELG